MLCNEITLRPSKKNDEKAIAGLLEEVFGRKAESRLALTLIHAPNATISLVALCSGRIAGHVLLTEIEGPARFMALAPLAVHPDFREMQVGSTLVRDAITRARKAGFEAIFVLGDNFYYERFGFSSPLADPFEAGWQGQNFMALELKEGCLKGKSGRLAYPEAFFNA
jgi:putative acetyltransferase